MKNTNLEEKNENLFAKMSFEFQYLRELYAEGLISKDLFEMTYAQLQKESEKETELEGER